MEQHRFYNNKDFSDVIVELNDGLIYCHKIVLAVASDVLNKKFTTEMNNCDTNVISFKDYDDEIVKKVIHLIYCGTVNTPVISIHRTTEQWCEMLEFANYLNAKIVVGALHGSVPADLSINQLLNLADLLSMDILRNTAADKMYQKIISDDDSVVNDLIGLSLASFTNIHQYWTSRLNAYTSTALHFRIFLIAYHYCDSSNNQSAFQHFAAETLFDRLTRQQVNIIINLPLVKNTLIERMLEKLYRLLPVGPDGHVPGKIETRLS
jgi:hypothetical protein